MFDGEFVYSVLILCVLMLVVFTISMKCTA